MKKLNNIINNIVILETNYLRILNRLCDNELITKDENQYSDVLLKSCLNSNYSTKQK